MKLHSAIALVLLASAAASTEAATITVFGDGTRAGALAAEATYIAGLGGPSVVEDFESAVFVAGTRSLSFLSPIVGTFTAITPGNTGIGAGCEPQCNNGLAILSQATTPYEGRFAIEDADLTGSGDADKKWLDSNDYKQVQWTALAGPRPTSLGFFLTDPSDVGATFMINATDGLGGVTASGALLSGLQNGRFYYVVVEDAEGLASLDIFSDSGIQANDGYGIDGFRISTPTVVPEPTGLFILGSGLVGLALRLRRK